jgi:hypothetical protein
MIGMNQSEGPYKFLSFVESKSSTFDFRYPIALVFFQVPTKHSLEVLSRLPNFDSRASRNTFVVVAF